MPLWNLAERGKACWVVRLRLAAPRPLKAASCRRSPKTGSTDERVGTILSESQKKSLEALTTTHSCGINRRRGSGRACGRAAWLGVLCFAGFSLTTKLTKNTKGDWLHRQKLRSFRALRGADMRNGSLDGGGEVRGNMRLTKRSQFDAGHWTAMSYGEFADFPARTGAVECLRLGGFSGEPALKPHETCTKLHGTERNSLERDPNLGRQERLPHRAGRPSGN